MLPAVLRFIFAREDVVEDHGGRDRDKQTTDKPLKKAIMRRLSEVLLYCTHGTVLYGTVNISVGIRYTRFHSHTHTCSRISSQI